MAKRNSGTKRKGKMLNVRSVTVDSLAESLEDADLLGNASIGIDTMTSGSEISNSSVSLSKLEGTIYKPKRKGSLDSEVSTPSNLSKDENLSSTRSSPWSCKRPSSKCSNASTNNSEMRVFSSYLAIKEVQKGLKKGELIEGILRINPKKFEDAYITAPDGLMDIYLSGVQSRNGALNGDKVVVQLNLPTSWKIMEAKFEFYTFTNEELQLLKAPVSTEELQKCITMDFRSCSNTGKEISIEENECKNDLPLSSIEEYTTEAEQTNINNEILEDLNLINSDPQEAEKANCKASSKKSRRGKRGKNLKKDVNCETMLNDSEAVSSELTSISHTTCDMYVSKQSRDDENKMVDLNVSFDCKSNKLPSKNKSIEEGAYFGDNRNETDLKKSNCFSLVQLLRLPNWSQFVQRTGKVVFISEEIHPRIAAGYLKLMPDKNPRIVLFSPKDHCIPRMKIPGEQCPSDFFTNSHYYADYLFLAKIKKWTQIGFALGELIEVIGKRDEIETETKVLLLENKILTQDFAHEHIELPETPWSVPQEEFSYRKDFRNQCIFTIDPSTARDLDDALSCEVLPSGNIQIGVHIADVSHFVKFGTKLDEEAIARGTSVYLVDKVIPMLPRVLCDNLCSLNPNEDRLAFSFIATLNLDGEILDEYFTRSVIRSCVKFSYEHVQEIIDQNGGLDPSHFPEITNGFSLKNVEQKVLILNTLSLKLRENRFNGGALSLDMPKLSFCLDQTLSLPLGFSVYERKRSHMLVEDFMLLANMRVAEHIHKHYPHVALLRKHPSPDSKAFHDTCNTLASVGLHISSMSPKVIMELFDTIRGDDLTSMCQLSVIMNMIAKSMKLAKYFCAKKGDSQHTFRHFALNVPYYTHFTSPIRRYPDIIVHRMLAATLGYKEESKYIAEELAPLAETLNLQKLRAKTVSDSHREIYLGAYIQSVGALSDVGIVCNVLDKAFDVHIFKMACTRRVYLNQLDLISYSMEKQNGKCKLKLVWKPLEEMTENVQQNICMFTMVKVICSVKSDLINFLVVIPHPNSEEAKISV